MYIKDPMYKLNLKKVLKILSDSLHSHVIKEIFSKHVPAWFFALSVFLKLGLASCTMFP